MPEVYDRAVIDGRSFDFTAGIERFREGMKQYFPREGKSIDKYIRTVRAVNRVSGLYYAEKVIPAPAAALAGSLLRAPFLRWAKRTTLEVLETITTNRELIGGTYGPVGRLRPATIQEQLRHPRHHRCRGDSQWRILPVQNQQVPTSMIEVCISALTRSCSRSLPCASNEVGV